MHNAFHSIYLSIFDDHTHYPKFSAALLAINARLVDLLSIHPDTLIERKEQIRRQLLAYCKLDTFAMVRLWQVFAGRADLSL